jgi:hypothetical protein
MKKKGGTIFDNDEKSFYLKNIVTEEYLIILSDKRFVNKYKMKQDDSGNIYIYDSGNKKNIVSYNIEDETYSFIETHQDESYFEKIDEANIILHTKSNNKFILELIDENNPRQKNFENMQNIREELCNKIVEYVLSKKVNNLHYNKDYYNNITCPNVANYEYLGNELCEFFKTLIIYIQKFENSDEVTFVLKYIFLKKEIVGGRLAYAIIQGIKMGIILLKAMDIEKKYIFGIDKPLYPMKTYLETIEKLNVLGSPHIYIEKCEDEQHFYWKHTTDEANNLNESILRFKGNGKYPLIIAGKEPIFAPDSATANAIKDHIISLIIKNMNLFNDTPFDFLIDISDVLVQTVFDKFIITKESNNLKIEIKYKQMFIRIDILNNVINEISQTHFKILQQYSINSINCINCKTNLSYYNRLSSGLSSKLYSGLSSGLSSKLSSFFTRKGGNKGKKKYKKDILGNLRCIYKIPGDRKEYVKHNGMLITVKKYKDIIGSKKKIKKI